MCGVGLVWVSVMGWSPTRTGCFRPAFCTPQAVIVKDFLRSFPIRQNRFVTNRQNLLGIKLGTALAAAGMKKVEFAHEMGVDPSAVTKWVRGDNIPSTKALGWLSQRTGEPVADLLGIREVVREVSAVDAEKVLVPKIMSVAAGNPVFYSTREKRGHVLLDRKPLEQLVGPIAEHAVENAVFACDVKGDSMSPGIQDGDVLIVRRWIPAFDPAARRPGVAIIEDEGLYVIADPKDDFESACVKRLVLKEKERRLVVLSDNKRHKAFTLDLTSQDFEEAKFRRWQDLVLGVPVKLIRDL